jgi:hypothetical protein
MKPSSLYLERQFDPREAFDLITSSSDLNKSEAI